MTSTLNFIDILSVSLLWAVHCCKTTEKWPTPCVYGAVILHYSSTYPHQIRWEHRMIKKLLYDILLSIPLWNVELPTEDCITGPPKMTYMRKFSLLLLNRHPLNLVWMYSNSQSLILMLKISHIHFHCRTVSCQFRILLKILPCTVVLCPL